MELSMALYLIDHKPVYWTNTHFEILPAALTSDRQDNLFIIFTTASEAVVVK